MRIMILNGPNLNSPYGYIVAMLAALQGAGQLPASLPAAVCSGPK